MRYLINEVTGDIPAGEAGAEGAAPAGGADSPEPSPVVESAAPAWQDTPEFQDAVYEATQAQLDQWQQSQPQAQQAGQEFDPLNFDWTDPEAVFGLQEQRDRYMLEQMQQMVAPLQQQAQAVEQQRQQELIADVLTDVQARTGYELPADMQQLATRMASEDFAAQVARNPALGGNGRIAEATVERHVRQIGQALNEYAEAHHQKKLNELQAATTARRDLTSGADGVEVPGEYETEMDAARAYAARLARA